MNTELQIGLDLAERSASRYPRLMDQLEHLAAAKSLDDLLAPLPDEFHGWVREVAADLLAKVEADAAEVERAYSTIVTILAPGYTRKEFAVHAVAHPLKWALFNRLDGKA